MSRTSLPGPGSFLCIGVFLALVNFPTALTARAASPAKETSDEFFIVSEVNLLKHQVVMEEPNETTITMGLTGKTVFKDEEGHTLPIKDMQAGDTVYVSYERDGNGIVTALTIREGPMTVEELHRRYFGG